MNKNIFLVGTHWGDEGKGKIVDVLTENASACVRFQGGHNAGHTLLIGGKKICIPKRPGEPDRSLGNIKKIKKELNWKPKIKIEDGIKELIKLFSPSKKKFSNNY